MHWALQGHSGARPCWNDQNPCEKTKPPQGLSDLKTCHWTLNFKPTIGIWGYVINDLRLFPVNIGSWTLKRDFSSCYACKHLFLNIVPLCNWHWACYCAWLSLFPFCDLFGFGPNNISVVLFFFQIGEDVKCCITCYYVTDSLYVHVALL